MNLWHAFNAAWGALLLVAIAAAYGRWPEPWLLALGALVMAFTGVSLWYLAPA